MLKKGMLSKSLVVSFLLVASLALVACGGGGDGAAGEPILSGSVSGVYGDNSFTVINGFALDHTDASKLIGLGDGPLNCDSAAQPDPPSGLNAGINLPSFEVGIYNNVMVNIYSNIGSFEGLGSNAGTVEITESSANALAGTVLYEDDIEGTVVSLNGNFEVLRCSL